MSPPRVVELKLELPVCSSSVMVGLSHVFCFCQGWKALSLRSELMLFLEEVACRLTSYAG